ncbi:glycoside hydrolase family 92 protein [Nocardioides sp. BP30]|uniref:glycoside hydrolase domain-containing protein n=1 Tax=Nocardioides sp. BP30 TaxID=3036374 RepID=UPI0024682EF4|nr:glycoside hydrolase domain-containing protein [Nocardioides sp. BP30]WGL51714.1 glycoside hydrolase family 92 protein [Nocardioides sp. BP30]
MPRLLRPLIAATTLVTVGGLALTPVAAHAAGPLSAVAATATDPSADATTQVNPFMSTQGDHGQNLPGAEAPHGLAKPNPLTSPKGSAHSGYDYGASKIAGFTLTNLDGVGGSGGGGDLLVVPTYQSYTSRPDTSTYALPFSHTDETATPGYYQVGLQASQGTIDAQLTATVRSGLEKFTFPAAGRTSLVFDLANNFTGRNASDLSVTTLADGRAELSGDVVGNFNGNTYKLYFDSVTDTPVAGVKTWGSAGGALTSATERSGTDTGAVMSFDVSAGQSVQLTTTLSPISVAQAKRDRAAELTGASFDDVEQATHDAWQQTLGQVAVSNDVATDPTGDLEKIFYTSLYRMNLTPVNATSTDGTYRGVDGKVHQADGYTHYDGWGTWDDFRKYSIMAYLYPGVYDDEVQSLVDLFDADANTGNASLSSLVQSVPTVRFERASIVIADAIAKGVHLDGLAKAYPAIAANENQYSASATALGYLPSDPGNTVAASYDDYAMSVIAQQVGNTADATMYAKRAGNYANVIKPGGATLADGTQVGLLASKDASGAFGNDDPTAFQAAKLYQGTLWQFNWYPSQDLAGLIKDMGGTAAAADALSNYFGEEAPDDGTKMLKSNANEVDLQTPYLFNYVGEPAKTQKWVRDLYTKETWQNYIATGQTDNNTPPSSNGQLTPPIKQKVFQNTPDGFLPTMDDDTGAMSSTFVAAAVGLYPVTAGTTQYQVGSPFFPRVDITHPDGTSFTVTADGVSSDDYYIQSATLDGKAYGNTWVDYSALVGNGTFAATMGSQPSTWGTQGAAPFSMSTAAATQPAGATVTSDVTSLTADASGGVDGDLHLTLAGATFAGTDGEDFTADGQVEVTGLPDGVTAKVIRASATTLTVHVSGTLPSQQKAKFAVQLRDAALAGGVTADQVTGTGLDSRDPFTILVTGRWRAQLQSDYAEARLVVQGGYTNATYAAFVTARDTARTVLATDSATDDQLQDADSDLSAAMNALVLSGGGLGQMQAVDYDLQSTGFDQDINKEGDHIGQVRPGSWIAFQGVSFPADDVPDQISVAYQGASNDGYANAAVEVRVGSPTGTLVATVATPPTATGFSLTKTATATITDKAALAGANTIYFVFTGSNADGSTALHWVANVYWLQFANSADTAPVDNNVVLTPDGRTDWGGDGVSVGSNTLKTETDTASGASFTAIANTHNGDWVHWAGVNFDHAATQLKVHYIANSTRVPADANIDVYLDSRSGTPLVNVPLPATGTTWSSDGTATVNLPSPVSGTHDVYIVMHATYSSALPYVGNIGDLTFVAPTDNTDSVSIPAVNYTAWSGTPLKTETSTLTSGSVQDVGGTSDGAWLEYDGISFNKTVTSVSVRYVNNSTRDGANSRVDVYLDSMTGTPVASVPLPYTGTTWSVDGKATLTLPAVLTGQHNVFVVMHTTPVSGLPNYVANLISFTFNYGVDKTGLQSLYDTEKPLLTQGASYVDIDFTSFTAAMAQAASVLDDDAAVGSDISAATRLLTQAAAQLETRARRGLMATVGDASAIVTKRYTDASVAALTNELTTARAMVADDTATDAAYATETTALQAAIDGLVAKATTVPQPPNAVSAAASGQTLTVVWAAPTDDGNSDLTGYTVTLTGGPAAVAPRVVGPATLSATFTNLARGYSYQVAVVATNAQGDSPAATYSASVPIAALVPADPDAPSVSVSGSAVTVTWTAPVDNGSPITGYSVRLGGGTPVTVPAGTTSHTFKNVAGGDYKAAVAAINAIGTSAYTSSQSFTVLPQASVTKVSAQALSWSQVRVGWTATTASVPSVLKVTLSRNGRTVATQQVWSDVGHAVFTGLAGGTAYRATVGVLDGGATLGADVRTPAQPHVRSHAVKITGKARVGSRLKVHLSRGSWSAGTHFTYEWTVNGKKVGTGAKLKVKATYAGKRIKVKVTGSSSGLLPTVVTSAAVKVRR